jgi:hypothetical protein
MTEEALTSVLAGQPAGQGLLAHYINQPFPAQFLFG